MIGNGGKMPIRGTHEMVKKRSIFSKCSRKEDGVPFRSTKFLPPLRRIG